MVDMRHSGQLNAPFGPTQRLLLVDEDSLGVDSFATHHLPLDEAPAAYQMKVVFRP
jgi:hypothetical protein